ncbi:MAG: imidazole glycerol phosphate synthase subunit HisF [Cytophagales bacterium]|nr:imidazole glycerol phosphate synthase subunit HisF [Cytophagales bacterium]MCA6387884.1 imidazole glycerol phosphate synthase subunit HisF [Cytophagales bacterium]MCA6390964.1 imidazole glycerol phosphate synthase subunit HisF [Cytophagales bacterium]MCA6394905.1 imidazole glycerol phosphate synthase subunit HisF [Cytophagales bacterium]MCA6398361.1 imidazole glycerol phosphate synthase subunit HisF [Cytophagales bacterium]
MLTKRIIPCLDIKDGRTVKGVNFVNIRDAGDPVELGAAYAEQAADELVFLDISATNEKRKTLAHLVKEIAAHVNIPFTVGGGISSIADVEALLEAGADKVSINSAAVKNPILIDQLAKAFGSQFVVLAIDARKIGNQWTVHTHGGSQPTEKKLFSWAKEGQDRGAGEILFTSMDHDGTKAGFALDPLSKLNELLTIPVIASGGAGRKEDFLEAFVVGKADAALAATLFHFGEIKIPDLKNYLKNNGVPARI